jgi:tol-pal system protein YbgF
LYSADAEDGRHKINFAEGLSMTKSAFVPSLPRLIGALGLAAALGLCASARVSAADSLDTRMDHLERDMRQLQQDYYSSAQGVQAGGGQQGAPASGGGGNEAARLSERIDSLEQSVRDLRGQMEQTSYQQHQILQRLDSIDQKLGTAPPAPPPPAAPAPPSGNSGDAGQTGAPQDNPATLASSGAVTPPPPPQGSLGTLPAGPEETADAGPTPTDEKGQFDAATALLYQGNRPAGTKALQRFIKQHPKSKLTPQAYYWLGEAQLADKSYRDAGQNFLTVVTKYQKDPVAPKSLVKLGSALIAGGQAKDGCKYLKSVKQVFPKADKSVVEMANRERKLGNCA